MIFAFGPGRDSYYVNTGKKSHWNNIPASLENLLRHDKHFETDKIVDVRLFPNGGYIVRNNKQRVVSENIPRHVLHVLQENGIKVEDPSGGIEIDSLNPAMYLMATEKGLLNAGLPVDCLEAAMTYAFSGGLKLIAHGCGGTWVIIAKNGKLSHQVRSPWLKDLFESDKADRIKSVSLSWYNEQHAFVEFTDGNSASVVPQSWRPALDDILPHYGKVHSFFRRVAADPEVLKFVEEKSSDVSADITTQILSSAFH